MPYMILVDFYISIEGFLKKLCHTGTVSKLSSKIHCSKIRLKIVQNSSKFCSETRLIRLNLLSNLYVLPVQNGC